MSNFGKLSLKLELLRSLVPKSVNVMALTTTATEQIIATVKRQLAMDNPVIVGLNSDRSNIKYIVKPSISLVEFTTAIASELLSSRTCTPKTVVFGQTLRECAEVFALIKAKLGR